MILRCTQKLLVELKTKPTGEESKEAPFWSWHGNMFHIERRKCVLLTNDKTRFAIFIASLKKQDFESFNFVFGQCLFKYLLYEKFPQKQIETVLMALQNFKYEKTNNRSVIGTMNEQRSQIEFFIEAEGGMIGTDVYKLNSKLNRIILSTTKYKYPIELFKEKLEETT